MSPIELFFAVSGLVLAIVFAPPVWHGIKKGMDALERLRWSGAQYRLGILQKKRHIGFDEWSCQFEIDDQGNCTQTYAVRLINLSSQLVSEFYLPIFCDTSPLMLADVKPWARARRKPLTVTADTWDEQRAEGRLKIVFPAALAPGERLRFTYGITLPRLFQPGDDYYDWDVEVPYYDLKGALRFSEAWKVKYARWGRKGKQRVAPLTFDEQSIIWSASFPERGTRFHLELGLDK